MLSRTPTEPVTMIGFRVPVSLKEELYQAAREDYRSVNAFLELLIKDHLEVRKQAASSISEAIQK